MQSDKITLSGMIFYGYHGVSHQERTLGQRFVVDLEMKTNLVPAGTSDDLSDAINYADAYQIVKNVVEGESKNLLEAVAEVIALHILSSFDLTAVCVRLTKPSPPIPGAVISAASVEINRSR